MKKLENWSIVYRFHEPNPYQPPEMQKQNPCLHGNVFGHDRFENGTQVTTSSIVKKVPDGIQTHSGSIYELGEVDTEYEKMYPNAKQRLFESLK